MQLNAKCRREEKFFLWHVENFNLSFMSFNDELSSLKLVIYI